MARILGVLRLKGNQPYIRSRGRTDPTGHSLGRYRLQSGRPAGSGGVYRRRSRWEQAQADLSEAVDLANRTGLRLFKCDANLAQARLAAMQGQVETARSTLKQAKALIAATDHHRRDGEVEALAAELSREGL